MNKNFPVGTRIRRISNFCDSAPRGYETVVVKSEGHNQEKIWYIAQDGKKVFTPYYNQDAWEKIEMVNPFIDTKLLIKNGNHTTENCCSVEISTEGGLHLNINGFIDKADIQEIIDILKGIHEVL